MIFLNRSEVYSAVAEISAIYRCNHYFETSELVTVQQDTVTEKIKHAPSALYDRKEVLKFIGRQSWCREMHTLRDNLLRITVIGAELCENQGIENDVIKSVYKFYKRNFPTHADSLRQVEHRMGGRV